MRVIARQFYVTVAVQSLLVRTTLQAVLRKENVLSKLVDMSGGSLTHGGLVQLLSSIVKGIQHFMKLLEVVQWRLCKSCCIRISAWSQSVIMLARRHYIRLQRTGKPIFYTSSWKNCSDKRRKWARKAILGQQNVVTAQRRTDPNQNTGISIHNLRVMAADDLKPVLSQYRTYLGRPWKQYSRTVYLQTYLDTLLDLAGWLEWDGDFTLDTLYYGEYIWATTIWVALGHHATVNFGQYMYGGYFPSRPTIARSNMPNESPGYGDIQDVDFYKFVTKPEAVLL